MKTTMKNVNFDYVKYHKEAKAMKSHVEKLKVRGCKLVEPNDKKVANAYFVFYDNDKGWAVNYRFGKKDKEITFKKGDKFYFTESVAGKGIVEIVKVTKDTFKRDKMDSYDLKGINFTHNSWGNSYEDMIKMIEDNELRPI